LIIGAAGAASEIPALIPTLLVPLRKFLSAGGLGGTNAAALVPHSSSFLMLMSLSPLSPIIGLTIQSMATIPADEAAFSSPGFNDALPMKMPLDPSCWQWSTGGALRFACFPGGGGEELLLRRAAGDGRREAR